MKANTTYHMQGIAEFIDGTQYSDVDHLFTTGSIDPRHGGTLHQAPI